MGAEPFKAMNIFTDILLKVERLGALEVNLHCFTFREGWIKCGHIVLKQF